MRVTYGGSVVQAVLGCLLDSYSFVQQQWFTLATQAVEGIVICC